MKITTTLTITAACIMFATTLARADGTPKGWLHAGSRPKDYEMTVDHRLAHGGNASATVKCIADKPEGFGTLMQTFKADAFRGQRIRLSGYVRSDSIGDWAGLWMRVDGPASGDSKMPEPLAFDNMQQRAIKGTTDWTKYEIVLDVPTRTQEIAFGILLTGKGQVWIDDLNIEPVGKDVPTTGTDINASSNATFVNMDFEE